MAYVLARGGARPLRALVLLIGSTALTALVLYVPLLLAYPLERLTYDGLGRRATKVVLRMATSETWGQVGLAATVEQSSPPS